MTATKVFFPQKPPIQVHQNRVHVCPEGFPPGFFWYANNQKSTNHIPKWITRLSENRHLSETEPNSKSNGEPSESNRTHPQHRYSL